MVYTYVLCLMEHAIRTVSEVHKIKLTVLVKSLGNSTRASLQNSMQIKTRTI